MTFKLSNIPFCITIISFFVPIINHLVGFELSTVLIIIVLLAAILTIKPSTTYPVYFLFFLSLWFVILFLHFVIKKEIAAFGYMQSFYYASVFYLFFKNSIIEITESEFHKKLSLIYKVIFYSLIIELIFNILGKEQLLLELFSGSEARGVKSYQILPSRLLSGIIGLQFNSLNSIFFGPQSASLLALLCWLFFHSYHKLHYPGRRFFTISSLFLLIVANTMTASLIFLIFLFYFVFLSKSSGYNNVVTKIVVVLVIFPFFTKIFQTIFFVLFDDSHLELYLLTWFQPLYDLSKLSGIEFIFGILGSSSLDNYTSYWEFGLVQMIYLTGILPVVFWILLLFCMITFIFKYRKYISSCGSTHMIRYYQLARSSFFLFLVSMLSLFHYLSIFTTGYFQLLGLNLAVLFYSIDKVIVYFRDRKYIRK